MNYALIKVINGEFYFSIEVLPNFDEEQARDAMYKLTQELKKTRNIENVSFVDNDTINLSFSDGKKEKMIISYKAVMVNKTILFYNKKGIGDIEVRTYDTIPQMKDDFKYYTQYAWKRKRFSDVSYRGIYAVTENNNLVF